MLGKWIAIFAVAAASIDPASAAVAGQSAKATTIVLVHGAFADSSSWNAVVSRLEADGYPVIAAANPLRSLKTDAEYVARLVHAIPGPVVLVGHSYGGGVISVAAETGDNIKALVFVAGFAPAAGDSPASLAQLYPTGTLVSALAPPVPLADGTKDLYIDQTKFWHQFAADSSKSTAAQMAATQRPITEAALGEAAEGAPAWQRLPSWFIYGSLDRNIPADLHAFMAKRAKARAVIEVKGASHALMLSHSAEVASLIERAATAK